MLPVRERAPAAGECAKARACCRSADTAPMINTFVSFSVRLSVFVCVIVCWSASVCRTLSYLHEHSSACHALSRIRKL